MKKELDSEKMDELGLIYVNVKTDTVGSDNAVISMITNGAEYLSEEQQEEMKDLLSKASAIAIEGLRKKMQNIIKMPK